MSCCRLTLTQQQIRGGKQSHRHDFGAMRPLKKSVDTLIQKVLFEYDSIKAAPGNNTVL